MPHNTSMCEWLPIPSKGMALQEEESTSHRLYIKYFTLFYETFCMIFDSKNEDTKHFRFVVTLKKAKSEK